MQLKRDNITVIPDGKFVLRLDWKQMCIRLIPSSSDWDVEKTDFSNTELVLGEFQK